ncbi:MAG: CopD family protein [Steroidobacteraceae bacterium]
MFYLKTFHVLMVMSWVAGLFYLPRIFVHYAEGQRAGEDVRRLKIMARKLYHFMSAMAVLALASGIGLWLGWKFSGGWLHAKLAMVALLIAFHIAMRVLMRRMQVDGALPGPTALRWLNEAPLIALIPLLYFVIAKPF